MLQRILNNAKTELKDRDDQISLLNDMLNSSLHENKMKDQEIDRLQKKLRTFQGGSSSSVFKSLGKLRGTDKHNRTENTFLPASLKSNVKHEASFPLSSKSGHGAYSQEGAFPSVKGAQVYTDDKLSRDYDNTSQRSQSQISLAISQKRGEKIVQQNRKKLEQMKNTTKPLKGTRVTSIEPVKGSKDMVNLKIQEEDATLEEGTMQFNPPKHYVNLRQVDVDDYEEESGYEEGHPDDYELNEI